MLERRKVDENTVWLIFGILLQFKRLNIPQPNQVNLFHSTCSYNFQDLIIHSVYSNTCFINARIPTCSYSSISPLFVNTDTRLLANTERILVLKSAGEMFATGPTTFSCKNCEIASKKLNILSCEKKRCGAQLKFLAAVVRHCITDPKN